MSTPGTIDRPLTHGPVPHRYQELAMAALTREAPVANDIVRAFFHASSTRQNRNRDMQLIPEALARAHMEQRRHHSDGRRTGGWLVTAHRLRRSVVLVSVRARRALAMAVMQ